MDKIIRPETTTLFDFEQDIGAMMERGELWPNDDAIEFRAVEVLY